MLRYDIKQELTRVVARKKQITALGAIAVLGAAGLVRQDEPALPVSHAVSQVVSVEQTPLAGAVAEAADQKALDLPDIEHPRVNSWIERFTTSMRGSFATYLERMPRYEEMISEKLAERDMPQDLIYLAMIESGFNPTAKSPVSARGLWQFMSPTAREYGLRVGRGVDERTNPARSTDAALTYLSRLYDRFGSWYLAAAAYNTGQGRVARIMRQETGRTKGTDQDYYRIAHRLPRETRDYVPKMIAAARIGNDPAKYGFGAG